MSKLVRGIFCHDLPIYKDVNGVYCSTTLTDGLFRRYFCAVDELIVATRVYPLKVTYEEAHQEQITLPHVKILDLPNLNGLSNYFSMQAHVRKILTEQISNVDLIFIRGGVIARLSVDIAKKLRKPYLIECAGCAWEGFWYHSLKGKLVAPYMEYRERIDVRDASYVIYVTEKWLQKRYPTKARHVTYASNVILTGVDPEALSNRINKIKNKKDKDVFVIGTTAAINHKAKGQQYVIKAMKKLKTDFNIRYELVGGGSSEYLESVAKECGVDDKVIFKGQLNHEEVLKWLDGIDLYIQPSQQEGLPRALIEAMSRGCPAIGSKIAGIPELLQGDVLFKAGSVNQLISVMRKMFASNLSDYAIVNYNKATEYKLDVLNERRNTFYKLYRNEVVGE